MTSYCLSTHGLPATAAGRKKCHVGGTALLWLFILIYLLPVSHQGKERYFFLPLFLNRLPQGQSRKREEIVLLRQKGTLKSDMIPLYWLLVVGGWEVKEREGSYMT